MPSSVRPTLQIVDRVTARTAAHGSPDSNGNIVGDPARRAVARDHIDAAGVAAARGHHGRCARRSHEAGRIQRLGRVALAAGVEAVGDWAVRTLVALKHGPAAPPTETAEIARLALNRLSSHQRIAQAIGDLGESDTRAVIVDTGDFEERPTEESDTGEIALVVNRVAEIHNIVVIRNAVVGDALWIGVGGTSKHFEPLGRDRKIGCIAVTGVINWHAELVLHVIQVEHRPLLDEWQNRYLPGSPATAVGADRQSLIGVFVVVHGDADLFELADAL